MTAENKAMNTHNLKATAHLMKNLVKHTNDVDSSTQEIVAALSSLLERDALRAEDTKIVIRSVAEINAATRRIIGAIGFQQIVLEYHQKASERFGDGRMSCGEYVAAQKDLNRVYSGIVGAMSAGLSPAANPPAKGGVKRVRKGAGRGNKTK